MKFKFKAKIYKAGINPCVKVPRKITSNMVATKGYISVKGKIRDHVFTQTLVPVKGEGYRLYVNGPMIKGADVSLGQIVNFEIEQASLKKRAHRMHKALKKKLVENNLLHSFKKLSPSHQKEILKYLSYIKTEETLIRNVDKVVKGLKGTEPSSLFRLP